MKRKYTVTFVIEGERLGDDVPLNKVFLKEGIRLLGKNDKDFCNSSDCKVTSIEIKPLKGVKQ